MKEGGKRLDAWPFVGRKMPLIIAGHGSWCPLRVRWLALVRSIVSPACAGSLKNAKPFVAPASARERKVNVRRGAGFSLIELMTVVAVMGILLSIAVPGYRYVVTSNRLATAANDIVAAFNTARMEAIRRNSATQLCGSTGNGSDTLGTSCGSATAAAVYVAEPNDADGNAVSPSQTYSPPALPSGVQLGSGTNSMVALRFGGQGLAHTTTSNAPYTGLLADVYSIKISSNNHRCLYVSTGSAVSSCSLSTSCPNAAPTTCQ